MLMKNENICKLICIHLHSLCTNVVLVFPVENVIIDKAYVFNSKLAICNGLFGRYCYSKSVRTAVSVNPHLVWVAGITLVRGNETLACADRHKLLPNVKGSGEIRAARRANGECAI